MLDRLSADGGEGPIVAAAGTSPAASSRPAVPTVAGIVAQVAEIPIAQVTSTSRLESDLALDSLGRIELLSVIETGGLVASVVPPPTPLFVDIDVTRMGHVLSGLIGNACKFSRRGGRIEVRIEQDGGLVAIRVRDSGVGIPADVLPHVFELFAQPEPAPDRLQSGLGVGLSIARRLVEMHGGTIEARSDGHDTGSEFVVRLPAAQEPVRRASRPAAPSRPSGETPATAGRERRRILVADDNVDSARSLAQLLTLRGHDVRTAYQGGEAYEMADWFRPHVALLDLGMPNGDGFAVCRKIRSQPWGRRVTMIAVTAWRKPTYETASRDAGFEHYLVKPIEPSDLMTLLDGLPASPEISRESPASELLSVFAKRCTTTARRLLSRRAVLCRLTTHRALVPPATPPAARGSHLIPARLFAPPRFPVRG